MKKLKVFLDFILSLFKGSDKKGVKTYNTIYAPHNLTPIDRLTLEEINIFRTSQGLSEVVSEPFLDSVAFSHSMHMANNHKASHNLFSLRVSDISKHFSDKGRVVIGENVAYGFKSSKGLVNAWANSKTHREVLKGKFSYVGISNVSDKNGKIYSTAIFLLIK